MNDAMFNTINPMTKVPTTPNTTPAWWKASGMARNPPPMVALIMCTIASMFLFKWMSTTTIKKARILIRYRYINEEDKRG